MATIQDRRTDEEKSTHTIIIQGTDTVLSGWGGAANGTSVAAWACRPEHRDVVEAWVRGRKEMKRVTVGNKPRVSPRCAHYSLYVVDEGHPALGGAG